MPAYRVEAIANEFVKRAQAEGRALTNMQLQKLPYIAHGWGLALTGSDLVSEEPRAFPYGPVYRGLYDALKRYGAGQVKDFIHEGDGAAAFGFDGERGEIIAADLSEGDKRLLDAVWDAYKNFSAYKLSEMTHQEDSPWTITTKEKGLYQPISKELILKHFNDLLQRRRATA